MAKNVLVRGPDLVVSHEGVSKDQTDLWVGMICGNRQTYFTGGLPRVALMTYCNLARL